MCYKLPQSRKNFAGNFFAKVSYLCITGIFHGLCFCQGGKGHHILCIYHIAGNFGEVFNLAIWQIR